MQGTVSKLSDYRKKWETKIHEIQKTEEINTLVKEQKLNEKDKLIEKHVEKSKYLNNQFGLYLSELNNLKKSDQELNLMKEKEVKIKLKEKILGEHRRKSMILEQIKEDQKQIFKYKSEVDTEILLKKEKIKKSLQKNFMITGVRSLGSVKPESTFVNTELSTQA